MRLIVKDANYAVLDDVLPEQHFKEFWKYFNLLDFAYRSSTEWQKVWRINDGAILASNPSFHSKAPFGSPMDWLHQSVYAVATQHLSDLIGKEGEDWKDIQFTPYLYPCNTKISWHDDGGGHAAACIFYPHIEWNCHWGGELMVARTPNKIEAFDCDFMTRNYVDSIISEYGMGAYFAPKPNRLIFTSRETWHSINRVDPAAGDHIRCSITAFFTKDKHGD